ncbi:hypothetical protein NSK_000748 [Nannochloropsis salina CCMP1776]|uniref:Mannosyltransferase n=1 Tax=Nannochloropsis salina CCMP1776 TaxID=1027361 RepID=A0A4D9DHU2_9STRA|nr:hypothetical protein NSK_000748 [Nannochloropsis salina CCMP1776]|eukprot:TFJ88399.1 hypothetical protein NSK_000748 [Nannochloropsis salina CCMP1776]
MRHTPPLRQFETATTPPSSRGHGARNARGITDPPEAQGVLVSRVYGLLAGLTLVLVRVVGGIVTPIADCDETYNYWEPVHYLLYGTGMQTWEYSPEYTLRSYAYLLPPAALGKAGALALRLFQGPLLPDKRLLFYFLRVVFSLISASSEATFVDAVTRCFGARPGFLTFALLLTSAGMFQASPALLPSSAASNFVMVTTACWLSRRYAWATLVAVTAVLGLGWPFVALLFLPLALHTLYEAVSHSPGPGFARQCRQGFLYVLSLGVMALVLVLPPVLLVDGFFYRRCVLPVWSILRYNLGGAAVGADDTLYGVEPWSFYLKNLLLNFNVVLPLVLLLPFLLLLVPPPAWPSVGKGASFLFVAPAYLWLGVMTTRPHKEERFLFPIYPLLALGGALSLHVLVGSMDRCLTKAAPQTVVSAKGNKGGGRKRNGHDKDLEREGPPRPPLLAGLLHRLAHIAARGMVPLALLLHALLSLSRAVSMTQNFSAPLRLFDDFSKHQRAEYFKAAAPVAASKSTNPSPDPSPPPVRPARLCLGAEWYRFPSSFFLPHAHVHLAFVRAGFGGQLPQPFRAENGTWAPPLQGFNAHNLEEKARYVPIHSCRYLVELFPPAPGGVRDQGVSGPSTGAAGEGDSKERARAQEEATSEDERIVHDVEWIDRRLRELGEARPVAWRILRHYPLLDKDLSPSPWRAFWVPFGGASRLHYGAFTLLEREEEDDFDPGPWSELGFIQ